MKKYEFLTRTDAEGVTTITVCRPPANALNHAFIAEMHNVATDLCERPRPRAVILRSDVPGMFMAGADLSMVDSGWDRLPTTIEEFQAAVNQWEAIECPTIALISGFAAGGGCELALACDFRVMVTGKARIGLPEVKHGMLPAGGGTQRLARLVGRGAAMDLLATGRMIKAEEAERIGLVQQVCSQEDLDERGLGLAREFASLPPLAVAAIKRCVLQGLDGTLERGLDIEKREMSNLGKTHDAAEGVRAFVEKRKPVFRGE